ncbi:Activating signal cointegrator 1 complex subunit 1 [Blattella germanica]|nr:Activating signal cointegrator 1 complex subunit 1 [Blattella germanica]
MDILKPELIWIEGRCYRINPQDAAFSGQMEEDEPYEDHYSEENVECPVEEEGDEYEIETTESGRYRISVHIAKFYFSYIIGSKGAVRRRLENETKTQIRVPKQGQDGNIKCSCEEKVLEDCRNCRGVDESIFQSPDKLHLTLGTLVLMDREEREKAMEAPFLQNRRVVLCMFGVEYMNDDPAEVDVLYGKVHMKNGPDENFEEYNFGDLEVDNLHLSLRHSKAANGYYQATAVVSFRG